METISAYHITDISNIKSIIIDGLVPDIGKSSRSVHENNLLVYFTTKNNINRMINMLGIEESRAIILNFECDDFANRGAYFDCCTSKHIYPKEIKVVEKDKKIPIKDFYNSNKDIIDLYFEKEIALVISKINDRLKDIKNKKVEPESDAWDYNEIDPNIITTLDLLKMIRYYDNKEKYKSIINNIKKKTFSKLKENQIEFSEDTELYKVLDYLFEDSIKNKPEIEIFVYNYLFVFIIINLYYRQNIRYNKTGKIPNSENEIWDIYRININDIPKSDMLNRLIEETKNIHEQMSTNYKKR